MIFELLGLMKFIDFVSAILDLEFIDEYIDSLKHSLSKGYPSCAIPLVSLLYCLLILYLHKIRYRFQR